MVSFWISQVICLRSWQAEFKYTNPKHISLEAKLKPPPSPPPLPPSPHSPPSPPPSPPKMKNVGLKKNSVNTFGQNFSVKTLLGPKPYTISVNPKLKKQSRGASKAGGVTWTLPQPLHPSQDQDISQSSAFGRSWNTAKSHSGSDELFVSGCLSSLFSGSEWLHGIYLSPKPQTLNRKP